MREPVPLPAAGGWFSSDEHLRWLARHTLGESVWPVARGALEEAGRLVPDRVEALARHADAHPPRLPEGATCIDDVVLDPAFSELDGLLHGFGLVRMSYQKGWRGLSRRAPRALSASLLSLFAQADQGLCGGPLVMSDALCRTLERHDPGLAAAFVPALAAGDATHLTGTLLAPGGGVDHDPAAPPARAVRGEDGAWRLFCGQVRSPNAARCRACSSAAPADRRRDPAATAVSSVRVSVARSISWRKPRSTRPTGHASAPSRCRSPAGASRPPRPSWRRETP